MVAFVLWGDASTQAAAGGDATLAAMGHTYLRIVGCTPLLFVLSVNSDALRNEGRAGLMALMSLLVSLSNIAFNYLLIASRMGVAGSALGTALAQASAALILGFRLRGNTVLRPAVLWQQASLQGEAHAGARCPPSFIGIALGSRRSWRRCNGWRHQITQSHRVWGDHPAFDLHLPAASGAVACNESITGNLYGAGEGLRARESLRLAIGLPDLLRGGGATLSLGAAQIASWFVADPGVIAQVAHSADPWRVVRAGGAADDGGDAFSGHRRCGAAALLGLAKPYLFSIADLRAGGIFRRDRHLAGRPLAEARCCCSHCWC